MLPPVFSVCPSRCVHYILLIKKSIEEVIHKGNHAIGSVWNEKKTEKKEEKRRRRRSYLRLGINQKRAKEKSDRKSIEISNIGQIILLLLTSEHTHMYTYIHMFWTPGKAITYLSKKERKESKTVEKTFQEPSALRKFKILKPIWGPKPSKKHLQLALSSAVCDYFL